MNYGKQSTLKKRKALTSRSSMVGTRANVSFIRILFLSLITLCVMGLCMGIGSFKGIIDNAPDKFDVYSGDDAATLDIMRLGGAGVISTIGNVAPERMKEIVELAAAGRWDEAEAANEALLPLMKGLFATANPILVKEALKLIGFPVGGVRLPLVDATPEQSATLAEVMREVGVLA